MDVRVYSVDDVRVDGLDAIPPAISISVKGQVNSTGWTNPRLIPWTYAEAPKDGIIDFDFIATAPVGFVNFVFCPIGLGYSFAIPAWVIGVRIHAAINALEAKIEAQEALARQAPVTSSAEGLPLPWPFPWISPPKQS
jgi:hypothetical protein